MDRISRRQCDAWLLTALVGPILSVAGRNTWMGILPVAILCPALNLIPYKMTPRPKWLCVVQLIWLAVFLGGIARESGTCWEAAGKSTAIPIILLLLAAMASHCGEVQACRVGATLVWLVLPVLGIVMLAGVADVRTDWLDGQWQMPSGILVSLLIVPSLVCKDKKSGWLSWVLGLLAVGAALLLESTLGRVGEENGFYEFSKGINLFGVAERFEPLVACTLTASWFALFCVIFVSVRSLAEEIFKKAAEWSVWVTAGTASGLLYIMPKAGLWLGIGSLIFWVFLPGATQGLVMAKKDVKK